MRFESGIWLECPLYGLFNRLHDLLGIQFNNIHQSASTHTHWIKQRRTLNDKRTNPMLLGTLLSMNEASSLRRVQRARGSLTGLKASSFAGTANSNSPLTPSYAIPGPVIILDALSVLVHLTLELRKEREEPEHEFVILRTLDLDTHYRIERRPLEGTNFNSKLNGCKAEDTITPLDDQDYHKVSKLTNCKIIQDFFEPMPDLYTVFAICDAIRKDPNAEKYTLAQFNCYFFARTLTLLIARHFLLRQYCRIHKSPRNDFGSLPGSEIDAIMDEAMNKMPTRVPWIGIILFDSDIRDEDETYKDLRQYILEMNKRHCKMVTQFGGKGDVVYDTLDKKMEEIWRYMHSDATPSKRRVDPNLALDSHATGEDIKELLLARAEHSNDASLSRLSWPHLAWMEMCYVIDKRKSE
ncbi:hypothetical protein F5887DRAFT_1157728 [Amanita rubescens]|nr:hypothetical protein F5887DRAFT_1157728 [Amanita rubescens]